MTPILFNAILYILTEMICRNGLNEMTNYTIKQLKKMNTERLHKVFQAVMGYSLFNPYSERDFMIASVCVDEVEQKVVEPIITNIEPVWVEETNQIGYAFSTTDSFINKLFAAINHVVTPVRTETKGRKSRFDYHQVWQMLLMDIHGVRLTDIAKEFKTSCVVVTQILTGASYQWATGINQESF